MKENVKMTTSDLLAAQAERRFRLQQEEYHHNLWLAVSYLVMAGSVLVIIGVLWLGWGEGIR